MSEPNLCTPAEIGAMVAQLPDETEVVVAFNAGAETRLLWTAGVMEVSSPTKTPEPRRWARQMLLGVADAMGMKL